MKHITAELIIFVCTLSRLSMFSRSLNGARLQCCIQCCWTRESKNNPQGIPTSKEVHLFQQHEICTTLLIYPPLTLPTVFANVFTAAQHCKSHRKHCDTKKPKRTRRERTCLCNTLASHPRKWFLYMLARCSRVAVRINIIQSDASFSGRQSDIGFYPRAHEPDRHSVQLILIIGEASINIQLWRCERFQITENSGKFSSWRAVINCVISSESTTLIKHIYKSLKVSKDASHIHVIFGNYSYQHALPHNP